MLHRISIVCLSCLGLLLLPAAGAARTLQLRIAKASTPVGTIEQVRLKLAWPDKAASGELQLWAGRLDAPALGYRFNDVHWRCPLRRIPGGWDCDGALRAGQGRPMRLHLRLDETMTHASLQQGATRLDLARNAPQPALTTLDLRRVPLAWAQALLAQAWPQGRLNAGSLDGRVQVIAPATAPLQVKAQLDVHAAGFDNADASIAGADLGAALRLDYRSDAAHTRLALDATLQGGELLAGNTYVALPATPVGLRLDGEQHGAAGWQLPRIEWRDGEVLQVQASARMAPDGALAGLQVQAQSDDMAPLKPRYLSGWMGLFGLGDVELKGAMTLAASLDGGTLTAASMELTDASLRDPAERFVFDGLRGDLRYSAAAPVRSTLQWDAGQLYGLAFGAARLPFRSEAGTLRVDEAVRVPMLGGSLGLHDVVIRPPQASSGTEIGFGLQLDRIDFGKVAQALGLPAFQGKLSGDIPRARYANDRIDFDGGLRLGIFDGQVAFTSLALERPFGTAPSLSADIAMDGLDLLRLTEVLGFGSVSGKLDGRIDGLRLVDWTPVAFDARFITEDAPGVRRRISQRAVQDLSSVGGASFIQTLQGKAIALFDDFGYRRIGIGCRLENQICAMSGLHSAGNAFTIVEGQGVPRLDVVGHNRAVNWPTLLERLIAAGKGDVAPVIN